MLGGGTSRCLWLGGDGATSPMEKRACKRSLNCYGKSNVNVINENSTNEYSMSLCQAPRSLINNNYFSITRYGTRLYHLT
jgi:hypothetical protein